MRVGLGNYNIDDAQDKGIKIAVLNILEIIKE